MKFKRFLDVARTPVQTYFKDGVELIYPDQSRPLRIAILPAYDPSNPDPTGWIPAIDGNEESDFYTVIRAAKFVGHGNRRAKTSILSPRTFDINADDPYEAFYDYCSRSDRWSYLTKDGRGKRLTGEVEGAVFPRMKNFFCANVIDADVGPRGGVFVTELSESVMKSILYSERKTGKRLDGLAFVRDEEGDLMFGDITNPFGALVIEVAFSGKGYVAREVRDSDGNPKRIEIPETLLQHRLHMEEPGSFLVKPESGQEVVDKLADMLRGYKHPENQNVDEIKALKEAMEFAYGDRYFIAEKCTQPESVDVPDDPFGDAAKKTVSEEPDKKVEEVSASVDRGVASEQYTPVSDERSVKKAKAKKPKEKKVPKNEKKEEPKDPEFAPGEIVDPSDIESIRSMLAGGS